MDLDEFQKTLGGSFDQVWHSHNEDRKPETIYHYTSASGLCGILTERVLFASDLFCLNDPLEFQYGKSVVMEALRIRRDVVSGELLENFESAPLFPHVGKDWSIYSVSFCGTKDLLGQWRGYGGISGYAVGMNLSAILRSAGQRFALIRILYDPGKQREVVDQFLSAALQAFESAVKWINRDDLLTAVGTGLIQCIFNMKHPAFRGEDEWRILLLERHGYLAFPLKFRPTSGLIVPHLEFPFDRDWVSTVTLGPTVSEQPSRDVINRLLETNDFVAATCEPSAIRLR